MTAHRASAPASGASRIETERTSHDTASATPPSERLVGVATGLAAGVLTVATMMHNGLTAADVARFSAAVLVSVVLPGAIVAHGFRVRDLPTRLAVAFTAGLGPQIFGWWVAVHTGQAWLTLAAPLAIAVVVGGFVCLVTRRRRDGAAPARAPGPRSEPDARHGVRVGSALALLFAWAMVLRSLQTHLFTITPLDHHIRWYQDMDWHLAITADAMHHAPPTDPQSAAEGALSYHWFSNAHGAALAMASGVSVDKVTVVAWYLPVAAAALGVVFGFARWLSRSSAGGAGAAILFALPPVVLILRPVDTGSTSGLVWLSPSHIFSLPVCALLAWAVLRLLREPRVTAPVVTVALVLALMGPGTKVSLLPTILGGVGLVFLRALVRRRGWLRPLVVGVVGCLIIVITASAFAGGGGGSKFVAGATATQIKVWKDVVISGHRPSSLMLVMLVTSLIGTYACCLLVTAGRTHLTRGDDALLMYAGMLIVAFLAMFLLAHPSMSQVYFMRGLAPVTAVFIAWGGYGLWVGVGSRNARAALIMALVLGWVVGTVWQDTESFQAARTPRMWWLTMLAVLVVVTCSVLVSLIRADPSSRRHTAGAIALAALLGYGLTPQITSSVHTPSPPHQTASSDPPTPTSPLSRDELAAAAALAHANPKGHLVATNVHCRSIRTTPFCDSRSFWVAAYTASPVDIGAWGYSNSARVRHMVGGRSYLAQPYYDEAAFRQNETAFRHPTATNLAELKKRGVRFLYADRRASSVSNELLELTTPVFVSPTTMVLRLR